LKQVEYFLQTLAEQGFVPGISVLVGKRGNICLKNGYGYIATYPDKELLTEKSGDILYDLASLTKPLVTAFLTLYLIERQKSSLHLETSLKTLFPGLSYDVNIKHLLTHTSGLPEFYPFYLFEENRMEQMSRFVLQSRPGRRINYSCVGYILLYHLIEKLSGTTYIKLAQEILFAPLKLKHTFFKVPEPYRQNAAPTELGDVYEKNRARQWARTSKEKNLVERFPWRETLIRGETHDVNSYLSGGTAGNAGLFSTTEDVFKMSREFFPSTATILTPESVQLFWKNFTPLKKSHRTLGFKRNSSFITSGGRALSRSAIGHNGFTGTSMWFDSREKSVFLLFSNSIHPQYKQDKPFNYDRIRRKIHRLLVKEYL
jgi:serine-type D-Ala-D-Ala carboxypeptidase